MNILITGNLSSLAVPLVKEFVKERNRIVLASYNASKLNLKLKNVILHSINPAENIFQDALSSYKFDVVIYLSTREEQLGEEDGGFYVGQQLDGLRNTLEICKGERVKRFFFVSSTEVYGDMTDLSENTVPHSSSINGHTLLAGEKYCRAYRDKYEMNITILRLPNIFGSDEKSGLLHRLVKDGYNKKEIWVAGAPDAYCSFLHVDDVVDLINRAIDEEYSIESLVVNLSSSKPVKYSELVTLLNKYHPSDVTFKHSDRKIVYTKPVNVSAARKIFDWVDYHDLTAEIEDFIRFFSIEPIKPKSALSTLVEKVSKKTVLLHWTELILGAVLVQYLSQLTGTLIQFKYVDFRLLFVVIMGSIYGLQFGLFASVIVSLSVLYTWLQLGTDWTLLVYNVGNWFPFAMYFSAGLITGYSHDKTENAILYGQKQNDLILEKYAFLYEVFNEIRDLKDEFRERLIGYRDSFGKIFTITRELDELQEHVVYSRALNILEELLDNKNIAIYSLGGSQTYARLEVNSIEMNEGIAKSLKLSDFPEALESIEKGVIFENTALLANYPAYIAPVLNNSYPFNVPVALIVIWVAEFEQYSTYYNNLFKVICGMVEASLVRATLFMEANYEKMYLPATRILNHDSFVDMLKTRLEMKKNKILDFRLLLLEESEDNVREKYPKIIDGIRSADIVGMQQNGTCYILLAQADEQASLDVIGRLEELGIKSRLIETSEVPLD